MSNDGKMETGQLVILQNSAEIIEYFPNRNFLNHKSKMGTLPFSNEENTLI